MFSLWRLKGNGHPGAAQAPAYLCCPASPRGCPALIVVSKHMTVGRGRLFMSYKRLVHICADFSGAGAGPGCVLFPVSWFVLGIAAFSGGPGRTPTHGKGRDHAHPARCPSKLNPDARVSRALCRLSRPAELVVWLIPFPFI